MFFIEPVPVEGLGNRTYPLNGPSTAMAIDPPRDIDRILAL